MKEKVKVSLVQFAPEWLEREANTARMQAIAEEQAQKGAELVVFPELANLGYITPVWQGEPPSFGPGVSAIDFALKYIKGAEPIPGPTTQALESVAKRYRVHIIVGMAQRHPVISGMLYNSAALIGPQGVIGVHHKMHLPINEKHYFYPGSTAEVYPTELGNIGLMVCYDASFPELPRLLALKGAEILCSVHATPKGAVGKVLGDLEPHKHRAIVRAQENAAYYISCNRAGIEGATEWLGHSAMASPNGVVLAFSETEDEDVLTAELENDQILRYRATSPIFRDRRPDMYTPLLQPLSEPYRVPVEGKGGVEAMATPWVAPD
ncbi:MAG: carbon-nitrogen hydrolase family protein [Dehalococcoidia bacterium]|jgi:predicted amidohydrolase|nr:carbon-nitrogen hydrolase family protein [Dehalococcoidia bacterium]